MARAQLSLGSAVRRAGRRADAREPLREALDLAVRCGADAVARTAREELEATGERVRSRIAARSELTASELRVVRLAADGLSNRDIAQALFVTVKTVETHLYSAFRKLDVKSRRELATALGGMVG
jgi:DNA-binding NarL/FixJ family response regulator